MYIYQYNNFSFGQKSFSDILIKNAINRSLNTEEKIDLNIKAFNPRNKVYFRKFISLNYNQLGIAKRNNLNKNINKEYIGNIIPERIVFLYHLKIVFQKRQKIFVKK